MEQPVQLKLNLDPLLQQVQKDIPFDVAFLALASVPGLGHKGLRALVKVFGDGLGTLWQTDPSQVSNILSQARVPGAQKIVAYVFKEAFSLIKRGENEVESLARNDICLLSPQELPPSLKQIPDAPLWLFVEGNPEVLGHKPIVAVVGTRRPSEKGRQAAQIVARLMAAYPIALVSGLAEGIDATVHRISLQENVPNIAFLGHGIRIIFPRATAALRAYIVERGGAVITEYLPDERYDRGKFVARNRLQAALADLVIPVEGSPSGGTAHTVRFAHRYRRPVLGLRWNGSREWLKELSEMPLETVDPFTKEGRRFLDERFRRLAEQAGHRTWALTRVAKLLAWEMESRMVREEDIEVLLQQITSSRNAQDISVEEDDGN